VSDLQAALPDYTYVMKTDVKGYYESIDHTILLRQLDKDVTDPFIWHLRKALRIVNQHFHQLKVEQAPDKTFIGKISKGWDFLGYHFDGKQLTVAAKTVEKHVLHYRQLYEQLRKKKATSIEMASALGLYVKSWQRWAAAGLQSNNISVYEQIQYQRAPMQIGQ
jgi:retron-type reverse transcriptase